MTLMMVATSALTALLFHLLFFSCSCVACAVLCAVCCVLCCVLCFAVLCAVLCGVESGNSTALSGKANDLRNREHVVLDLFSNFECVRFFRLQVIIQRGPSHGKQKNDDARMYLTLG